RHTECYLDVSHVKHAVRIVSAYCECTCAMSLNRQILVNCELRQKRDCPCNVIGERYGAAVAGIQDRLPQRARSAIGVVDYNRVSRAGYCFHGGPMHG